MRNQIPGFLHQIPNLILSAIPAGAPSYLWDGLGIALSTARKSVAHGKTVAKGKDEEVRYKEHANQNQNPGKTRTAFTKEMQAKFHERNSNGI